MGKIGFHRLRKLIRGFSFAGRLESAVFSSVFEVWPTKYFARVLRIDGRIGRNGACFLRGFDAVVIRHDANSISR
jgi:hypothetical protein